MIRAVRAAAKEKQAAQKAAGKSLVIIPSVCPNRGEQIRLQPCHTCKGQLQIKVFACAQHGECTIGKQLPGVHLCRWPIPEK